MLRSKSKSDNWQGAFGNLMFLLFAVFLSVYALSRFEVKKLKEEVEKVKAELAHPPIKPKEASSDAADNGGQNLNGENTEMRDQILTSALKLFTSSKALESAGPVENWLEVEEVAGGKLLVRIAPKLIYGAGDTAPDPKMLPLLNDLAALIRSTGRSLKIEGHADGEDEEWLLRASKKGRTDLNLWSISSARAAWLAHYWVKKFDFNPERIEVTGFGSSKPLPQTASVNPHKRNQKRIELLLERAVAAPKAQK